MENKKLSALLERVPRYECILTYHVIKNRLAGKFLEVEMDIFEAKIRGIDVFLTAGVIPDPTQTSFLLMEAVKPITEANPEEFRPLFEGCKAKFPSMFPFVTFISSEDDAQKAFAAFMEPMEVNVHRNPLHSFYMSPKQQEKVMALNIALPEGYRFDKANMGRDAQVITETWIHSGPNEIMQTRLKLRDCPSALIRFRDEQNPVAFEICTPFGTQNHQYVFKDHRQKGLGGAVEIKISQECIKTGLIPFKFIELWNESVLKWTNANPLWSRKNDENGEPVTMVFALYTPKQALQKL